jgi:hypothetical protein
MLKTTLFCAALVGTAVATKHAGVKRCTGALPHWQDYNPNWENAGCSFEAFCSTKPQSESEMRDRKACVEAEKAAMKGMASIEGLKAVLTAAGSASTKPDSDKAAWRVSVPGFKNTDTAVEKTYRKPKTPIPAAELYDINRGMVVFKSPAYMFNYMHVLEATLKTYGYEVVLFKNRFCNVGASGYRDMKIGLKKVGKFNGKKLEDIDWGEVAEVQFLIEPFATIKSHHKGKKDHGISDKEEKEKTSYLKKAVDYLKTETTIPTLTEAMHNGHIMYERSRAVADDNSVKHLMPVFLQRLMNDFVDDNEFEITDRKENMVRLCSGAKAAHSFSTETFVEYGRKHPNSIYNKLMSFNLLEGKLKCEEKPMFQHKSGTKIQKQIEEAEEEARTCVGEKKKDTWTCLENFDKTLNIHFQAATDDSKDIHPEKANKAFLESFSKFVMNDSGFCHNNGGSSGVKLLRGNNN